jgi:hypothetical protein
MRPVCKRWILQHPIKQGHLRPCLIYGSKNALTSMPSSTAALGLRVKADAAAFFLSHLCPIIFLKMPSSTTTLGYEGQSNFGKIALQSEEKRVAHCDSNPVVAQ